LKKRILESEKLIKEITNKKQQLSKKIKESEEEAEKREIDLVKIRTIFDKKEQIKSITEKIEKEKIEISILIKRKKSLEGDVDENSDIEQKYENLRIELQEISILTEENVDSEISFKQRELERTKVNLKQASSNSEEILEEAESIKKDINTRESTLEEKRRQEEELSEKFKQLISERDSVQKKIHGNDLEISGKQNEIYNIEQIINNLKIAKAKFDAEYENLEIEMLGFPDIEIIKTSKDNLIHKLEQTQDVLSRIGSVNLRSLEVYDSIKNEYDSIKEKSELISREKEGILKIVHEIDIKKKKTFTKTLDALNEVFSSNFSQLSTKGHVFLELENKKDPFEGGVNIIVKTGHGKYFDATSLSGGEQTLVALSLIFAIQEHKPYFFYILDEIDAALDKRNSERLANLLKRYMKRGQYIVITHNDEVISNATALYGISMHEGISKITSLKI
jgi:chromosome segregation protein